MTKLFLNGRENIFKGDISSAESLFRKAIKKDPERPEAYLELNTCYNLCGSRKEAKMHLEMAVEWIAFLTVKEVLDGLSGIITWQHVVFVEMIASLSCHMALCLPPLR